MKSSSLIVKSSIAGAKGSEPLKENNHKLGIEFNKKPNCGNTVRSNEISENCQQCEEKGCGKKDDGDSGLVVDCPRNSSVDDHYCGNETFNGSENLTAKFAEHDINSSTNDSGLGIDLQNRFNKLSCVDSKELQEQSDYQCNRISCQPGRPRPLENITTALRNAENISKHCSRIINQISPAHRMRLVEDAFASDEDGDTRLHLAIIHNRLDIIFTLIYLVSHSSYLDIQNDLSQTPLHLAVLTGQSKVVRRLVLAGASPVIRDRRGNTPLHLACERGELECVKELTRPVTPIELQYLKLMNSAVYECMPCIATPPNLEIRNYEGRTCVHLATLSQHTEILLWLKQFGANINAQESKGGRTPLTYAVEARNSNLVGFLVEECEADVDVKNYAGLSAFQIAYRVDEKIANQLESLGAYPSYPLFSDSDSDLESMDTSDESSDVCEFNGFDDGLW